MGTVFLTPVMRAFVEWNMASCATPTHEDRTMQEAFEAGYRAGMLADTKDRVERMAKPRKRK